MRENPKLLNYIWMLLSLTLVIGGAIGHSYARRIKEESRLKLKHEEKKLELLENSIAENESLKSERLSTKSLLAKTERDVLREVRSFSRPQMKSALIDRLELPTKDCVFSVTENSLSNEQSMLVYASYAGQTLSIPIWDSHVELEDPVKSRPQHHFQLAVTPGKIHRLRVGLVNEYSSAPRFVVRFDDNELLNMDLKGLQLNGSSISGSPNSSLFLPGRIGNVFDFYSQKSIDVELFRKGLWLKYGDRRISMQNEENNSERFLMFCVCWLTSGDRFVSESDVARMPNELKDEFRFEANEATTLHRVVPKK